MHRSKQRFLEAVARKKTLQEPKYEKMGTAYLFLFYG
jgi:hypothetical protein